MAEIKLNDSFSAEVDAFRSAGNGFDAVSVNSVSADGLSLPTVDAYQDRLFKIRNLIIKLKLLTRKDAGDMDALAAMLKATDASGS